MNYIKHILVSTLILVASGITNAQQINEQPVDTTSIKIDGTWYAFSFNGGMREAKISDKLFITTLTDPARDSDHKDVDSTFIKKLDNNHYLVQRSVRAKAGLAKFEVSDNQSTLKIIPLFEGENEDEVLNKLKSVSKPAWGDLEAMTFYSESKFNQLKEAPGLDEVSRDDWIKALSARKEISPLLVAYMKAHPNQGKYRLYRFSNNYRNEVFIKMGYNPYKMVKEDPIKKFENDAEFMKVFNEPMSWEN